MQVSGRRNFIFLTKNRVQNDMIKQEFAMGLNGGRKMLKILRIFSWIIAFALSGYSLITKNFELLPFMLFFFGVFVLVTGLLELQAKRKRSAITNIFAASFAFFVSIYII